MVVPMIIKIGNLMMFQKSSKGLNTGVIPGEIFLYDLYFYHACTHFCRLGQFAFFRSPLWAPRHLQASIRAKNTVLFTTLRGGIITPTKYHCAFTSQRTTVSETVPKVDVTEALVDCALKLILSAPESVLEIVLRTSRTSLEVCASARRSITVGMMLESVCVSQC